MNLAHINQNWVRWVDGRSIDDRILGDVMSTDPNIKNDFVSDLAMHRQLNCMARTLQQDDSFVEQMLAQFDSLDSDNETISTAEDTNQADPDHPVAAAISAPAIEVQSRSLTDAQQPSSWKGRWLSNRNAAVLAGLLMYAATLLIAFVIGRGSSTSSSPANDPASVAKASPAAKESGERRNREEPEPSNVPVPQDESSSMAKRGSDSPSSSRSNSSRLPKEQDNFLQPDSEIAKNESRSAKDFLDPSIVDPSFNKDANPEAFVPATFASVVPSKNSDWRFSLPEDKRIASGILDLRKGRAEIQFDNGARMALTGPARLEVVNPRTINVYSGEFDFQLPADVRWLIESPSSSLETTHGASFTCKLEQGGNSEIQIRDGQLGVRPWVESGDKKHAVILQPNQFDSFQLIGQQPSIARFTSKDDADKYRALLNINGKVTNVESRELAESSFAKANQKPNSAEEAMKQLLERLKARGGKNGFPSFKDISQNSLGEYWINGKEVSKDEFEEWTQKMKDRTRRFGSGN